MEIRLSPERIVPFTVGAVVGVILATCFWVASLDRSSPLFPTSVRPLHQAIRIFPQDSNHRPWNDFKIACVVLVTDVAKSYTVANLWGRRCDYLQFYTNSRLVPSFLRVQRLKSTSDWDYFCQIVHHLHLTSPQFQWFLFTPDYTYVILENLRSLLQGIHSNEPHYLGHIETRNGLAYNSGQAPIVISLETLHILTRKLGGLGNSAPDTFKGAPYDYILGKVLHSMSVFVEDCRDRFGRDRFPKSTLENILFEWSKAISSTSVSFRTAENPHLVEYLLYSTNLFNVSNPRLQKTGL